jgi:hypothetical protein
MLKVEVTRACSAMIAGLLAFLPAPGAFAQAQAQAQAQAKRLNIVIVTLVYGWHPIIEGSRRLQSE